VIVKDLNDFKTELKKAAETTVFLQGIRIGLVAAMALLAGCATKGALDQPGGVAAPSGRKVNASAIIESMQGGLIGGPLGQGLTSAEKARALEAEYRALEHAPAGQAVAWRSDSGSVHGEAVAAQAYRVGSQDCRQFMQTVVKNGQQNTARGTACRNPDGSWTPLN
jgi:surface antigen